MANKRIRYSETNTVGVLRSVKSYQHPDNGGRFTIEIDTNDKKFNIVDELNNKVVQSGVSLEDTEDCHYLKKQAKDALISLGIPFEPEGRTKAVETVQVAS